MVTIDMNVYIWVTKWGLATNVPVRRILVLRPPAKLHRADEKRSENRFVVTRVFETSF